MKSIVIISGPVGAGKSTVAKELVASIKESVVYIEGDTFWSFIAKSARDQSRYKNFKTVMVAMTAAAVPYALAGYEVILDFSIPPWFIDTARKVAGVRDVPLDYVVLRPNLSVCELRAANRAEGAIADYTPYRALYSDFDEAKQYTIADDTANAGALAAHIRSGLKAGRFRVK